MIRQLLLRANILLVLSTALRNCIIVTKSLPKNENMKIKGLKLSNKDNKEAVSK